MLNETFGWLELQTVRTSVLHKTDQRTGTWPEFVEAVGKHTVGPKEGRCIAPFTAAWNEDEISQPRSGAHEKPGARWGVVTLDLDEITDTQLDNATAALDGRSINYLVHSTHSYDPEGTPKCRLHIHVASPLTVDTIPLAKARISHWLGLTNDKATKGGYSLFYTPRAPQETFADAFWMARTGRNPLYVETLQEPPAALGKTGVGTASSRTLLQVQPRDRSEWPEVVVQAAERQLRGLANVVRENRAASIRERLKRGVSILAGYAAAGLLDMQAVYDQLADAIRDRHAKSNDDQSLEHRLQQLVDFCNWGGARPILPEGYTEAGEHDGSRRGDAATQLRNQLKRQKPTQLYTTAEANAELGKFLRSERGMHPWLGLVEVSVGCGKTHTLREVAAERAARGEFTIILSLDHGLLGQIRRDLQKAGVGVRHMHSLQQATSKTGGPECEMRERPDVVQLVKAGASIAGSVCPSCPVRPTCEAIKHQRRALTDFVVLAPYQMARRALELCMSSDGAGAPLVVCDEEPPPPHRAHLSMEQLYLLTDDSPVWPLLRPDQAAALQLVTDSLRLGLRDDLTEEDYTTAAGYHGQLHAPGLGLALLQEHSDALQAARSALELLQGWRTLEKTDDGWQSLVPSAAWQVLGLEGGFVLSATPNYDLYESERFGLPVDTLTLRVKDAQPATRVVLETQHATRRKVMPEGDIQWDLVEADLKEVFRLLGDREILIGTYKAISDALKTTHAHLLENRKVHVTHYEIVRGRDDWRGCDAFVSLYDPRTPSDSMEASTESAARTLEQFHGRARNPQPRPVAAIHVHFGMVAPTGWWSDDTGVGDGRATALPRAAAQVFEKTVDKPRPPVLIYPGNEERVRPPSRPRLGGVLQDYGDRPS